MRVGVRVGVWVGDEGTVAVRVGVRVGVGVGSDWPQALRNKMVAVRAPGRMNLFM